VTVRPPLADRALLLVLLLSWGAVGLALYTQHRLDMQPCPWCVLQRLVFVAIGAGAVLGLLWRGALGAAVAGFVATLLAGLGMAAALWQHFVAAASASCNLTFADRFMMATGLPELLPDVFTAWASCADAKVNLLGLPYEFWSLGLFVVLDLIVMVGVLLPVLRQRR
jgi:disulfide bond formation protein DsbB